MLKKQIHTFYISENKNFINFAMTYERFVFTCTVKIFLLLSVVRCSLAGPKSASVLR